MTNCPITSLLISVELFGADGLLCYAVVCAVSYVCSGYRGLYSSQTILYSKLRAKLDLSEFLTLCRAGGWFDLSQLETVVFEHNGNLSFLPREAYRAAQPTDLSLSPKQSVLMTPVIMDGEVLPENLRSVGKDEVWLTRKLREQGYSAFGEVFLALCDGSGEAPQLYPIETKKTPREDGK